MEEKSFNDIELRSEEVQAVMNKIPSSILRYGIGVMATIILIMLIGSTLIPYPEKIEADLTLGSKTPPVYIKCKHSGRIEYININNGAHVRQGDVLAVIENLANTEDILRLRHNIQNWQDSGARIETLGNIFFNKLPRLGSVQSAYSSCLLSWNNYMQHKNGDLIHEIELGNAFTQLLLDIRDWENSFLLVSPTDGHVSFMQLLENNQYVNANETILVIVHEEELEYIGKALLPIQDIGKVKIGQRAIVRLNGIAVKERDFCEGKVTSISPIPDENGNYVIEIGISNELFNNRTWRALINVIHGKVEVIVKEENLFERFFVNF